MVQLQPWTHRVSDHLMNAQAITRRAVTEGQVTPETGQAILDAIMDAQQTLTAVDRETLTAERSLLLVANVVRYGTTSGRLRKRLAASSPNPVALQQRLTTDDGIDAA